MKRRHVPEADSIKKDLIKDTTKIAVGKLSQILNKCIEEGKFHKDLAKFHDNFDT